MSEPKRKGFRARASRALDKVFKSTSTAPPTATSPTGPHSPDLSTLPPPPNSNDVGSAVVSTPVSQAPAHPMQNTMLPALALPSSSQTATWDGFHTALSALHTSSQLFPPLQSAIGGLLSCINAFEESTRNRKEHESLALELKALSESLVRHMQSSNSAPMTDFIARVARSIQEQVDLISKKQDRSKGRRLIELGRDEEIVISCYQRVQALFRQLQIDADLSVWSIANEHLANTRLEGMNPAKLASYDSTLSTEIDRRTCTKDTRTAVLSALDNWSIDPNAPNVFWMNGMAGTGKTTIACTFAETLKARKLLGATFFCARMSAECRDVTRVVPTIAYQLARYSTPFRTAICKILGNDPDIPSRTIVTQFEKLLKDPLIEVKGALPEGLVVVVDAIDECTESKGVEMVLDVLLRVAYNLPIKFLVASRPEPAILDKIEKQPAGSRAVFVLHEIKLSDVQADIQKYLKEELESVSSLDLQRLVELSGNLFIYSATVVRYLQVGNLKERLGIMLSVKSSSNKKHAEIDRLYTTILSSALDNEKLEDVEKERMRLVLWTAVCEREPMSIEDLAELVGIDDCEKARHALHPLRSVLYVSDGGNRVSALHTSFPDYMLDEARSTKFFCNARTHNQFLARRCFDMMEAKLRFNICKLESSYIPDEDVSNLSERIDNSISSCLAYCCRYWSDHLEHGPASGELLGLLQEFLSQRLLFWIEVMNVKLWIGGGVRAMLAAKTWLMAHYPLLGLVKFAEDAWNFVAAFAANPVSQCTPHIYISSLPSCHRSSEVFKHYWKRTRGLVKVKGTAISHNGSMIIASWKVQSNAQSITYAPDGTLLAAGCDNGNVMIMDAYNGGRTLSLLEGHTHAICTVAFSSDGVYLASASQDCTIRLWSVQDRAAARAPFEGHTDCVNSMAFSPDSSYIVTGSRDCTVRIWPVRAATVTGASLQGHTGDVTSVAFSADGTRIASGSRDRTIRIWNTSSHLLVATLQGHAEYVHSIAFSRENTQIFACTHDDTVHIWDVRTGAFAIGPSKGHAGAIKAASFSRDGTRVATCSEEGAIHVWNIQDRTLLVAPIQGHADYAKSVAFSPDGTRIVTSSSDRRIRVWNVQDGALAGAPFKEDVSHIKSVSFCPNSSLIASGSYDGSVRIWNSETGTLVKTPFRGRIERATSVAFSPHKIHIASGAEDHTVRLWRMEDGSSVGAPFEGHVSPIQSIAFSLDSTQIVSGSSSGTICVWNTQDQPSACRHLKGHTGSVTSVAFSPDGAYIVAGSDDHSIRVWDTRNRDIAATLLQGHTGPINLVIYSPDGTRIASCSGDQMIRFWAQDGTSIGDPLEGHTDSVNSVAFSSDGIRLVSGSSDRTIRLWNCVDGSPIGAPFEGHMGPVNSVAFSSDGMRIVSGSSENIIRIWSLTSCSSIIDSWTIAKDGWVLDRDSRRLFWVPDNFARYMPSPYNTWVIGPSGSSSIDYSSLLLGEEWHRCYNEEWSNLPPLVI